MMRKFHHIAVSTLALALAACGGPPEAARRAQAELDRGQFAEAHAIAEQELATHPGSASLWRIKMRAQLSGGDAAGAVDSYRRWRERRGTDDLAALRALAVTTLWQALRVPSAEIRSEAIGAIERLEIEELARDVAELIGDDDDRTAAAAAVALLRAQPGAPQVATQMLSSEDPRARRIAVEGIGRKIGARARQDLLPRLDDRDPAVRRAAASAIAAIDQREDDARLAALARQDPDGAVRAAAARAFASRSRAGTPFAGEVAGAALADAFLGARLAGVAILAARGDLEALERAAAAADPFVALRAGVALASAGRSPGVMLVERAAASDSWQVRAAAMNAVAEIAPKTAALNLAGASIVDEHPEVRLAAARVMLQLDLRERAIAAFADALAAQDPMVRVQAATDLVRAQDPRGAEALAALAVAPEPGVRTAAIAAHRVAPGPSDGLVAALADEVATIRLAAAAMLYRLSEEDE